MPLPRPKGSGNQRWSRGSKSSSVYFAEKSAGRYYTRRPSFWRQKTRQGANPWLAPTPHTPKSCESDFRSDQAGDWSLARGGTPEAELGLKLANEVDSVAIKSTDVAADAVNTADAATCTNEVEEVKTVLRAETRLHQSTRLFRNAARMLGKPQTSRSKLLQKLKAEQGRIAGGGKAALAAGGNPNPAAQLAKPTDAEGAVTGTKDHPSPNTNPTVKAPSRRAPNQIQHLARHKTEAMSLRGTQTGVRKGPVLDTGANT